MKTKLLCLFAISLAMIVLSLLALGRAQPAEAKEPERHMANAGAISDPAYGLLGQRVSANQASFYIYRDADSGFNHGFPSGFFGKPPTGKVDLDPACLDDPAAANGCSTNPDGLDRQRGTVVRITFASLTATEYAGVNFEEPENWGVNSTGSGYDLSGAVNLVFDVRSPTPGGIQVQFGVGGSSTGYITIPYSVTYTTMSIPLSSLTPTVLLTDTHILFAVATNELHAPNGGTLLLDNIRFEPIPTAQQSRLSFPRSTHTFGVIPRQTAASPDFPFPPDQVNRNITTIYESALTLLALLERGAPQDLNNARLIADTFVYALAHDNQGDPLPTAPDGSAGLHNAYMSGDTALFNDQTTGGGLVGQVRLAGFSCGIASTGFCLVLDGATGGNNAFAILALTRAYEQFGDDRYRTAALTIGEWIEGNLADTTGTGYGGYYLGYPDQGIISKTLQLGKSVENNADIFAAFSALAAMERRLGNNGAAVTWTDRANAAGDFVMQMYDQSAGRFYAGTVPVGTAPGPGLCPAGAQQGNDIINTCDFLDSNTFTTLAMAASPRYHKVIDWRRPVSYTLQNFSQTITAAGQTFQGVNIVRTPLTGANGIGWEFTGQAVVAAQAVCSLYPDCPFDAQADFYLNQIRQAQLSAPFGDGQGLAASTLQDGDTLPPLQQDGDTLPPLQQDGDTLPPLQHCLSTPFQCIPQRVGLAATTWAIFAEQSFNPLAVTAIRYVDGSSGSDTTGCTAADSPCATIGYALDQAGGDDEILVAKGTYIENLVITKTVSLKGAYDSSDWSRCLDRCLTTIEGNQSGAVIDIQTTLSETTVIDGFTLTRGNRGIYVDHSALDVQNATIIHNHTDNHGGGMRIDRSVVHITNSFIVSNTAQFDNGALRIISTSSASGPDSDVRINSSTIANNRAFGGGNGVFVSNSNCEMTNSIVWGHNGEDLSGYCMVTYSNIETVITNTGNISTDPLFADPANDDYRLQAASPAIDAGNNAESPPSDFEGDLRPFDGDGDGTAIVDMGADEFVPSYGLTVSKQASTGTAAVSQTITYTYRLANQGNLTLTNLTAADDKLGSISLTTTTLAPNQTASGILTYTVAESDLPGPLTNTVVASGTTSGGGVITATAAAAVSVTDQPLAGLSAANNGPTVLGSPTRFTAMATAGTNVTYSWAFGDGQMASGRAVTHTYAATGSYAAVVTAANSAGLLTGTTTATVLPDCTPVASVRLNRSPDGDLFAGNTVRFTAAATGTTPFTYAWTLSGASVGINASIYERTFTTPGTYPVAVTVTNGCGQDSDAISLQIQPSDPPLPDLSLSYKSVNLSSVESGDTLTYTLILRNTKPVTAAVVFTDPIPAHTAYVSGSARASDGGPVTLNGNVLQWSGPVISGTPVFIDYAVTVMAAPVGTPIINIAYLEDGMGNAIQLDTDSIYDPGYSLTIDDGALATGISTVTLRYAWNVSDDITHVKFSNDGGFGTPDTTGWMPVNAVDPTRAGWRLATYGEERLSRIVYAKFRDSSGRQYGPIQDDIIYDPDPPRIDDVVIISQSGQEVGAMTGQDVVLRVKASDGNSGVARLRVSNSADFSPYFEYEVTGPTTDIPWTLPASGEVYVRAVDRAGNSAEVATRKLIKLYLPLIVGD